MPRSRIALATCVTISVTAALAVPSSASAPKRFYATISGAKEVPAKGDPDGTAKVTLTFGDKLCYDIRPRKLETPQAAHIHSGKAGKAGGIAVNLFTKPKAAKNGKITGCTTYTASQLEKIVAKPGSFYVNLHSKTYPSGSARGQLTKTKPS
jgi:hypothetical protein